MASEVDNLYARYRSELKPLVAEYESQNEQIMPSCLVNLAQMFDRIALSETSKTEEERIEHLNVASGHLNTAISDTKEGVVAGHILTVLKFKRTYGQDIINTLKDGTFVGPFTALEKEVRQSLAADDGTAQSKLGAMVDMINDSHASALAVSTTRDSRKTIFLKWGFTIIVSLLVTLLTAWLF